MYDLKSQKVYLFITCFSLCSADERDRVQKKTFTKWVNKHLIKVIQVILSNSSTFAISVITTSSTSEHKL